MTITEPAIGVLLTLIGAGLTGFLTWMAKQIVAHARYSAAASETLAALTVRMDQHHADHDKLKTAFYAHLDDTKDRRIEELEAALAKATNP